MKAKVNNDLIRVIVEGYEEEPYYYTSTVKASKEIGVSATNFHYYFSKCMLAHQPVVKYGFNIWIAIVDASEVKWKNINANIDWSKYLNK